MKKFVLALLLALPLSAVSAPMTNDDVIRMVKAGLADSTVIQAIDGADPAFDTSADGLIRLKQGGVSDSIIQRILSRRQAAAAATPAAPAIAPAPAMAAPAPAAPAAAPVCRDCGVIAGIREIDRPGQGTGLGAVAGGVLGGALGRNVAGDRHRTAGTVLGAVGGGVAGHALEKHARSGKTWEINVRFDDGSSRVFLQDTHPSWSTGARVRLVNGVLSPM